MKELRSINFHITQRCNYTCHFCFGTFGENNEELSEPDQLSLIKELANNGCEKLNYAGGEPTLVKSLPNLLRYGKELGIFTSIISNGTGITKKFLKESGKYIDLIGLSIDSADEQVNYQLGRCLTHRNEKIKPYSHINLIKKRAKLIKKFGISLKINTVITPLNWNEDLTGFISDLKPMRWKVLELTPLFTGRDAFAEMYGTLKRAQYMRFIQKHKHLNPIAESNDLTNESYVMITPNGKFFQNSYGGYNFSDSILKIGVKKAFEQINFSLDRFESRDAGYYRELMV